VKVLLQRAGGRPQVHLGEASPALTYAVVHLVAVLLQVVLDAALEEVQLGLQLLREAEHAVLTPRQVGVVAQETEPGGGGHEG